MLSFGRGSYFIFDQCGALGVPMPGLRRTAPTSVLSGGIRCARSLHRGQSGQQLRGGALSALSRRSGRSVKIQNVRNCWNWCSSMEKHGASSPAISVTGAVQSIQPCRVWRTEGLERCFSFHHGWVPTGGGHVVTKKGLLGNPCLCKSTPLASGSRGLTVQADADVQSYARPAFLGAKKQKSRSAQGGNLEFPDPEEDRVYDLVRLYPAVGTCPQGRCQPCRQGALR
jgi:hypothetical protein